MFLRPFTTKSQWYCAHLLWNTAKLYKTHQKEREKEDQKHGKRANEGRLCVHVSVLSQRKVERNKGIMGKRGHEWEGTEKFFSSPRAETEAGRNDICKCSRRHWFCHLVVTVGERIGWRRRAKDRNWQQQSSAIVSGASASLLTHCSCSLCVFVCV